MGTAVKAPLSGLNHNVLHQGRTYHVQTELGGKGTQLSTYVFFQGTVVASKNAILEEIRPAGTVSKESKEKLLKLIRDQHLSMIGKLNEGVFDDKASSQPLLLQAAPPMVAQAETSSKRQEEVDFECDTGPVPLPEKQTLPLAVQPAAPETDEEAGNPETAGIPEWSTLQQRCQALLKSEGNVLACGIADRQEASVSLLYLGPALTGRFSQQEQEKLLRTAVEMLMESASSLLDPREARTEGFRSAFVRCTLGCGFLQQLDQRRVVVLLTTPDVIQGMGWSAVRELSRLLNLN